MLIDTSAEPGTRQLRWFAGLWFPALCVMLGFAARRGGADALAATIWTAGVGLGMAGLVRPAIIRPVYTGLVVVTFPIGWVVSHLILSAMYFLVIAPIGWLVRRFYDPMERRFDRGASSYWTPRESAPEARYFRQF